METIELPGYTEPEKLKIAKKYLIPRQLTENGLSRRQLLIKDDATTAIIRNYTREAGVRNLERNIAAICRSVATDVAKNKKKKAVIDKTDLARILGPTYFESELALRTGIPGVATAIAFTPVGGELLFIESASMPGKGQLQLTGHIGDVMRESAQAAFTVVKSNAKKLNIEAGRFGKFDYHIHVPAGAIPKDGPSAGVAMFISLVSLLLGKPVRPDVAMTGEITLRGLVLPIGGLKEKILAAKQAGIKTVILPARNKKDLPDVPREAKKGLKFKFVKNLAEALKIAIGTA
jgi:ATP-dependent Lon protease